MKTIHFLLLSLVHKLGGEEGALILNFGRGGHGALKDSEDLAVVHCIWLPLAMADPFFELRRGAGSILLALPAFLLSVILFFFDSK